MQGSGDKRTGVFTELLVFNWLSILISISLACKIPYVETLALEYFVVSPSSVVRNFRPALGDVVPALRCLQRSPRPVLVCSFDEGMDVIWKGSFQESCISLKVYLEYFYHMVCWFWLG